MKYAPTLDKRFTDDRRVFKTRHVIFNWKVPVPIRPTEFVTVTDN